mgnify:CR=1 FL=1
MRAVVWLVVGAISAISGGFAIPIGFSLGLSPLEVYVAATAGAVLGLLVVLFAGDKLRDRITRGQTAGADSAGQSRVRDLADRYGPAGLGLVGPIFPGVTASLIIGLTLGMPRGALAKWLGFGVAIMYALYTLGLWALIELIGVE